MPEIGTIMTDVTRTKRRQNSLSATRTFFIKYVPKNQMRETDELYK